MYFVTTKHADYVLFCMTPSERAAIGLTETQVVHLLVRGAGNSWAVLRQWPAAEYSHTELMASLGTLAEPSDPRELLKHLPAKLQS